MNVADVDPAHDYPGLRNWAVWWLRNPLTADPHIEYSGDFYVQVKSLAEDAQIDANWKSVASVDVYIPVSGGPGQIFIPTPEPASMLLFGTALLGTGWAVRRHKNH